MLPWINRQFETKSLQPHNNINESSPTKQALTAKFTPTKSKIGLGSNHVSASKKPSSPKKIDIANSTDQTATTTISLSQI